MRGGRFVSGMSGEQFALADAVERLREVRRTPPDGRCLVVSGADPLNLAGIVTAGDRVRAVAATRVLYRDGVPMAAMEGDYVRPLTMTADVAPELAAEVALQLRAALPGYRWLDDLELIPSHLRGVHRANPVNIPSGGGVQLELPPRVRKTPGDCAALVGALAAVASS